MQQNSQPDEDPIDALDYGLCGFDGTKLQFRGPPVDLDQPFVAALGGSETFGKYVSDPFPAVMSQWLGMPVMNFGVAHAGLSLFSEEQWLLDVASKAELTVLQVLGAQNMSNRLYSVHSRRNDRFLGVSPALRDVFPEVDFTEINFTGHLMTALRDASRPGFELVVEELKWAWIQRMRRILSIIRGDVLLVWISDHRPVETRNALDEADPQFIDQAMLDDLGDQIIGVAEYVQTETDVLDGKHYLPAERDAARQLPGPRDHAGIAEAVIQAMSKPGLAPDLPSLQARATGS
ncbi:MAG: DUF6473 family protein [Paracoccaceae bacterium]|nr:DUF6473 family protein [Paracoccaceae bacterium]